MVFVDTISNEKLSQNRSATYSLVTLDSSRNLVMMMRDQDGLNFKYDKVWLMDDEKI